MGGDLPHEGQGQVVDVADLLNGDQGVAPRNQVNNLEVAGQMPVISTSPSSPAKWSMFHPELEFGQGDRTDGEHAGEWGDVSGDDDAGVEDGPLGRLG